MNLLAGALLTVTSLTGVIEPTVYEHLSQEMKTEIVDISKQKDYRNAIVIHDQEFQLSDSLTASSLLSTETHLIQRHIDKGHIATVFNNLAVDGRPTYLAAHNPGAFSYIANNADIGDIVKAYDRNGKLIQYKINRRLVNHREQSGPTDLSNDQVINFVYNELMPNNREMLVLQYCVGDTIHLLIGDMM